MARRRKRKIDYTYIECPACRRSDTYLWPVKNLTFFRVNHYEEMLDKKQGVSCKKCGYLITKPNYESNNYRTAYL